jgi:hypothetical protein
MIFWFFSMNSNSYRWWKEFSTYERVKTGATEIQQNFSVVGDENFRIS